jgi:hypothetical protein
MSDARIEAGDIHFVQTYRVTDQERAAALVHAAVTVSLIRTTMPDKVPHTLNLSLRLNDDDANFMLRFIGGES